MYFDVMAFASQKVQKLLSTTVQVGERAYNGRRRVATGAVAVLAVMLGYHVVFGQNGLTAFQQKRTEAKSLDLQLKQLTEDNDRLRAHVDRLKQDPNAIEHEARESLHYTRPDEIIYTLPAQPAK